MKRKRNDFLKIFCLDPLSFVHPSRSTHSKMKQLLQESYGLSEKLASAIVHHVTVTCGGDPKCARLHWIKINNDYENASSFLVVRIYHSLKYGILDDFKEFYEHRKLLEKEFTNYMFNRELPSEHMYSFDTYNGGLEEGILIHCAGEGFLDMLKLCMQKKKKKNERFDPMHIYFAFSSSLGHGKLHVSRFLLYQFPEIVPLIKEDHRDIMCIAAASGDLRMFKILEKIDSFKPEYFSLETDGYGHCIQSNFPDDNKNPYIHAVLHNRVNIMIFIENNFMDEKTDDIELMIKSVFPYIIFSSTIDAFNHLLIKYFVRINSLRKLLRTEHYSVLNNFVYGNNSYTLSLIFENFPEFKRRIYKENDYDFLEKALKEGKKSMAIMLVKYLTSNSSSSSSSSSSTFKFENKKEQNKKKNNTASKYIIKKTRMIQHEEEEEDYYFYSIIPFEIYEHILVLFDAESLRNLMNTCTYFYYYLNNLVNLRRIITAHFVKVYGLSVDFSAAFVEENIFCARRTDDFKYSVLKASGMLEEMHLIEKRGMKNRSNYGIWVIAQAIIYGSLKEFRRILHLNKDEINELYKFMKTQKYTILFTQLDMRYMYWEKSSKKLHIIIFCSCLWSLKKNYKNIFAFLLDNYGKYCNDDKVYWLFNYIVDLQSEEAMMLFLKHFPDFLNIETEPGKCSQFFLFSVQFKMLDEIDKMINWFTLENYKSSFQDGYSPYETAIQFGHLEIMKMIEKKYGPVFENDDRSRLFDSVFFDDVFRSGSFNMVRYLVEESAPVCDYFRKYLSADDECKPRRLMCEKMILNDNNFEMIKYMMEKLGHFNQDFSCVDSDVLIHAIRKNNRKIALYLINSCSVKVK